jgi:hypothetical protein
MLILGILLMLGDFSGVLGVSHTEKLVSILQVGPRQVRIDTL